MSDSLSDLQNLIKEGKIIIKTRPRRDEFTGTYIGSDEGIKNTAKCHKWFMKCLNILEETFTKNSTEYTIFNSFYNVYEWKNLLGTNNGEVSFIKDDMSKQISHLEAIEDILRNNKRKVTAHFLKPDPEVLHPKIYRVSKPLYESGHYSQAILEAFKVVNTFVKDKAERNDLDGKSLMSSCFNTTNPILKLNNLETITEKDEQEGFMHLFMGGMQGIRNPLAHEITIESDPIKAFEYLSFASLLIRKAEEANKV
ncbi:MAG TPA: TIGR02391 family protein [Candidatus Methanoperedens sp.]